MGVKIKNISVKNLGPISQLSWDLENINLILGDNEKGKSWLVEFLIRSLFKTSGWNLRSRLGSGKVRVEGLENKLIEFSPSTSMKLEDFLLKKYIGLPPDFSKLLVFRGTNVELGDRKESDKAMLRRYLSHKEILDSIRRKVLPKTVKEWKKIDKYSIVGPEKDGLMKRKKMIKEELDRIDDLFTKVENKFLSGEMKRLRNKEEELKRNFEELEKAKRYTAYKILEEIKALQKKADQIDEEEIDRLFQEVNQLQYDKKKHKENEKELKLLDESTKHYEWLDKVIEEFKNYNLEEIKSKVSKLFPILFVAMIVTTGILIVLGFKWHALITLIILPMVWFLYKREIERLASQYGKREELKKIKEDYKQRFGEELSNIPAMEERKNKMEKDYHKRKILEEQMKKDTERIKNKELQIEQKIVNLFGEKIEIDKWEGKLREERRRKKEIEEQIKEKNKELYKLQVEEKDYLTSKPEVEFDWDKYREVNNNLKKVQDKISEKEKELNGLKHSICEHTKDDFSTSWMKLIENLANKKNEALKEYKELKAEIIATKYISDTIEELWKEEDEKIKEALNSDVLKSTLLKVTTHYDNISLHNDKLIVSDPYHDFWVSEISDGAKEQVFLSLRIGMAMHWFGKDALFLILDDAFLHSDDNRRPKLVKKILELGENEWQILCFTFDKRIKELFDEYQIKYKFFTL